MGALYTVVKTIYDTIDSARQGATTFRAKFSQVNGAIGGIQDSVNSISSSIKSIDNSLGGPLGGANSAGKSGNMALQAFYGVFIGFGFLALLGTLLTACCDKYGCRHLIYFSCFIMFLVGIVSALLATLFSLFIPFMTWGCSFLDVTLTQTGFMSTLEFMQPIWELPWAPQLPTSCCPASQEETETSSTPSPAETLRLPSTTSPVSSIPWEPSTALKSRAGSQATSPSSSTLLPPGAKVKSPTWTPPTSTSLSTLPRLPLLPGPAATPPSVLKAGSPPPNPTLPSQPFSHAKSAQPTRETTSPAPIVALTSSTTEATFAVGAWTPPNSKPLSPLKPPWAPSSIIDTAAAVHSKHP